MSNLDFSTYLSPFSWRYGSEQMRQIWSEENKRKLWRKVWVFLAKAQYNQGLVSKKELDDLIKHQDRIDIKKALDIESEIHHDLMAEVKTFASQAKIGGGKIHLGATSMDIEDNVDTLRTKQSVEIIEDKTQKLLKFFIQRVEEYKNMPCMGYTHLQPAEPTTLGYRFAFYAQDILTDLNFFQFVTKQLKGKGIKGAVGTAASYTRLLDKKKAKRLEEEVMSQLKLKAFIVTNQTSPRKTEYLISSALSSIAQSLNKFALDVRIMQSPGFGEWQEPFGKNQIGSSAMPFKKNPWKSEQICSLARLVFNYSNIARENAGNMLLERTLDDSANRRVFLPEIFLAIDEMLTSSMKIVEGLVINTQNINKNLNLYGSFSVSEVVMMEAVKKGADRQKMHEILRELSLKSWEEIKLGKENPLTQFLISDKRILAFLSVNEIEKLLDPRSHIGLALEKCDEFLKEAKKP